MIRDLSETLQALLEDKQWHHDFPELGGAQVTFDRPADDFNPSLPTLALFLFDVRENMELRSNEPQITRIPSTPPYKQASIARPPLRVACSYLLTAWPVGAAGTKLSLAEHRLLSQALEVLSTFPTIPAKYLHGRLAGQTPPLPMVTARTDGLKDPSEFWTALGAKLRASLVVTTTIAIEPMQRVEPVPVVATPVVRVRQGVSKPTVQQDTMTKEPHNA